MKLKSLFLFSAVASAICLPSQASAQTVSEITGQRILAAVDTVSRRVSSSQEAIVKAITGATTATNTAISETGKLSSEANIRTTVEMKKAELDTAYEPLDPCGVTAAAKGGGGSASSKPSGPGRGGSTPSPTAGATKAMQETLKIANGERTNPAPEVAAALAVSGACQSFAKGTLREAACTGAGFAPSALNGHPNADVRADTIFDGPQTAANLASGATVRKLTIAPGNVNEKTAVSAFIRNLDTPVDLKTLTNAEYGSEAGRNYMALRDSYDASMSLATKPLRDQESLITANKATLPILAQMTKGEDGPYVTAELDKTYPDWRKDGISYAHLMSLESSRRYLNEKWYARIAGAGDKQIAIESLQLQAFAQWTNVAILERLQQLSILQGSSTGSLIRAEKMPLLVAAHRAAKR